MHSISKLNKFIISSSAWFGGVFFYPGTAIIKAVLRLCEKNYKKMKKSVDKHKRLVYYIYCSRHTWAAKLKKICGEVSEWFKELVLKTSDSERGRGFESHPLRHMCKMAWLEFRFINKRKFSLEKYSRGWRGRFAKSLGFARAAWVRIPSSPPYLRTI